VHPAGAQRRSLRRMSEVTPGAPVAILAGGGRLPCLIADAVAARGRAPVVFAFSGEADPKAFQHTAVHPIRVGEIGRILRLIQEAGCREAVFIGSISRRPDFKAIRPDFATMKLLPRILQLLRDGDDGLLSGLAKILQEYGVTLVSPLAVAPQLALPEGVIAGQVDDESHKDARRAAEAARLIGRLDIGQAAVAMGGRVVAVEDAGGTDDLLKRVSALRERGRISSSGGVLVKCMKPQQDSRVDVPAIGPDTAEAARRAGLDGVAGEAGRTIVAGMAETMDAFRESRLFLIGMQPPEHADGG
jgi:DUF1009 family protein